MPNHPYQITTIATRADGRIEVTIQGPGLRATGQREVFPSQDRAASFVQALNFAYAQGLAEGGGGSNTGLPAPRTGNAPA